MVTSIPKIVSFRDAVTKWIVILIKYTRKLRIKYEHVYYEDKHVMY